MDAGDDAGEFATRRHAKAHGRAATAGDGRGTRFRLWRDDGDDDGRARRWAGDLDSAGARSGGIWEVGGKATRDARRDGEGVARALDFDDDDDRVDDGDDDDDMDDEDDADGMDVVDKKKKEEDADDYKISDDDFDEDDPSDSGESDSDFKGR